MRQIKKNRTQVAGSNKSPQIRKCILIPGLIAGFIFLCMVMIIMAMGGGSSSSDKIFPGIPGLNVLDVLEL
jgi:hypothetical protein